MKNTHLLPPSFAHPLLSRKCWLILLAMLSAYCGYSQTLDWATITSGGTVCGAYNIVTDRNGNVYTSGYFQGTIDFDPGPGVFNLTSVSQDVFVQKLDASGNFVWAKAFGSTGNDGSNGIAVDSFGHVYVAGRFSYTVDFDPGPGIFNLTTPTYMSDAFVLQLDTAGNFGWAKSWGSRRDDYPLGMATDKSGQVYVAGVFYDTVDFDPGSGTYNLIAGGGGGAFLVKLDPSGNFGFAKRMGSTTSSVLSVCCFQSVTVDNDKNIVLAGRFKGTSDFDPGAGSFTMTSFSSSNFTSFISKLDSLGNFQWAKKIGGVGQTYIMTVATDSSRNVFATGYFDYTIDLDPGLGTFSITSASTIAGLNSFTEKLDPNGNFVWGNQLACAKDVYNMTMCVDRSGNLYVSGMFDDNVDFDPGSGTFYMTPPSSSSLSYNAHVQRLDNNGNFLNAFQIAGTSNSETRAIAVDRKKNIYLAGGVEGSFDFDPGPGTVMLSSPSMTSGTVAKYSQRKFGTDTVEACDHYTTDEAVYTTSGSYTTTLTASDGPDSVVTLLLTIHTSPSAGTITGVDTVCRSSSTTLTASVAGGTWSVTDATTASVTAGGVVTGSVVGLDTVIYTVTDAATGCSSTVAHPIFVKNCQSNPNAVNSLNNVIDFAITPNPNSGNFKISIPAPNNDAILSITNISGQEIFRSPLTGKEYALSPDLPDGMYLVRLTSGNTTQVQKMIITR